MKRSGASNFAFKDVVAKLAKVFVEKRTDLLVYGEKNLLPKEILDGCSSSGTATNCITKIDAFIQADGFSDPKFQTKQANPKQTWGQMLPEAARSIATFEGVYFNIQYNLSGEVGDVYVIPFEEIRRQGSFRFLRKSEWKDESIKGAIEYPMFDPTLPTEEIIKTITQQAKDNDGKQLGFIHFAYRSKPGIKGYPVPDFYSSFEDIESDAALQVLERRNIKKGFKTDVIISTIGEIDRETKDEDGKTAYDYFCDGLKKFTGENGSSILHLEGKTGDSMPTVTAFPLKDLLNGIDRTRARVKESVCDAFGVPQILVIGEKNNGFGDTKALVNSMKLFNRMILRYQNMLSDSISFIYTGQSAKTTLSTLNLADYIDPLLYNDLTQDERRNIAGFDALPSVDTGSGTSLAETLGTGTTTSLKEVVADPVMEKAVKVQFLIIVFNLTEENANKLVYGTATPTV